VKQDYVQAHIWYNLAAARGQKIARENRALLAEKMTPVQIGGRGGACLWAKRIGESGKGIGFFI